MKAHTIHLGLFAASSALLICFMNPQSALAKTNYWDIQSVDTMKYSRDMAREWGSKIVSKKIIESVIQNIASTGATHVAVGTPYDDEFIPFLKIWLGAARHSGLNIWFRGNLSGWEGWFGYPVISKEEHIKKIEDFILGNPSLFEDGDIFTSCTECENGQIGDPRQTVDVGGYRKFLIDEYEIAKQAFSEIGKNVTTGSFSMNADVARLIMDEETTKNLGGVVVIDHYVKDPNKLAQDVKEIGEKSGGKVVLGEFGVPIPDIHGTMSSDAQAEWLAQALSYLSKEPSLIGINYWVSFGGTTAIWNNDGSEKSAVKVLRDYFLPDVLSGKVINDLGQPIENALIFADSKESYTDDKGEFKITSNPSLERVVINAQTYKEGILDIDRNNDFGEIVLEKEREGLIFRYRKFVYGIVKTIKNKWFN